MIRRKGNLEPSSTNRAPISKVAVLSLHMYILEIPLHFTSVRQWRGIRHVPCSLNASSETTIHCTIPWLAELCAAVNMNWELTSILQPVELIFHLISISGSVSLCSNCVHTSRETRLYDSTAFFSSYTQQSWLQIRSSDSRKWNFSKTIFFLKKHGFCFIPDSASSKGLSHAWIDRQGDQILLVSLSFCWFSSLPSALPLTTNSETSPHMV